MARHTPLKYDLTLPPVIARALLKHLFPGDGDEHGAVIAAGVARSGERVRLLARHVFLAVDGVDYVPGKNGYRMLTAQFVRDQALFCRDEGLAYLAVHNHGGRDAVEFSPTDMASHERGYPALSAITRGQVVGGLVLATNAVAGDLWLPGGGRAELERCRVLDASFAEWTPKPKRRPKGVLASYDRQARLFGDRGQRILQEQTVGIIGLGGVGSLVAEYLGRLGVGALVLVDPDRLDVTNLSRVVGSTPGDTRKGLRRRPLLKVDIAARELLRGNPRAHVKAVPENVVDDEVARELSACDYLFLCADSMQSRLVFNAIVHQYEIPGVQIGAKVSVDQETGEVRQVFSVVRPVLPGLNCLWCNGLISPERLQEEALTEEERRAQRYVDDPEVVAPSVITLNAVGAAHAVNDYLFRTVGLRTSAAHDDFTMFEPLTGSVRSLEPRADADCTECGSGASSRFGRGDAVPLPTRPSGTGTKKPKKGRFS